MKLGRSSYQFKNVYLAETATVVGDVEGKGPLADYFDTIETDPYFGEKSWEQAEMRMCELTIEKVIAKSNIEAPDIDLAFGGDLVNQLVPSNYAMRHFDIPFVGVYSACATIVEALILGSTFIDTGRANNVLAFSSSHNNMAEKQFRMPVEYGGPKGGSSQYTATGAGVGLLNSSPVGIKVEAATIGIVVDALQNNPADMGSAMAPAAAHTIIRHFEELGIDASHYDLIVTGDLASVGTPILLDLLKEAGHDISDRHQDCGNLLYGDNQQQTLAGGSGAGCVSIVMFSYLKQLLETKQVNRVLVVGTGALLNALIVTQKETIPCIAHAISLVGGEAK